MLSGERVAFWLVPMSFWLQRAVDVECCVLPALFFAVVSSSVALLFLYMCGRRYIHMLCGEIKNASLSSFSRRLLFDVMF